MDNELHDGSPIATPASVCVERQESRPANRRVPEHVVRAQHAAMGHAVPGLPYEGFDHAVGAEGVSRLEALLHRVSDARRADLGGDGGEGWGDLLLVRRCFGPEILPLWRWRDTSVLAAGVDALPNPPDDQALPGRAPRSASTSHPAYRLLSPMPQLAPDLPTTSA
ncbi:hypothetical protein [Streptomyces sp. NPDC054854]